MVKLLDGEASALGVAVFLALLYIALWFVFPLLVKAGRARGVPRDEA